MREQINEIPCPLNPAAAPAFSAAAAALDEIASGWIDKKPPAEIAVSAVVSGGLGAISGSCGGGGFVRGDKLLNEAFGSSGKVVQKGMHPAVKKAAQKARRQVVRRTRKKIIEECATGQGASFGYMGMGMVMEVYANEEIRRYR